ncbi:MAG: cupin-like domain-containing protein [Eudoraea sp.]|nr:cupin-like domain-containing protein [Eudoraea sp.]
MSVHLEEIERIKTIDAEGFKKKYLLPQRPVILEQQVVDWPAFKKWNLTYMKGIVGEIMVPLYDDRPVDHKDGFNEPHARMKMGDYIDLLKKEPTKFRIFLWNILKEVPQLQADFSYPDLGVRFLKGVPMLFFGGADSYTFMHYDIDLANIFHIHFEGEKELILFPQSETKFIYKVPHSLITHESIDFANPDYGKWPGLKFAKGFRGSLNHGEMLYIPEGYWHYMQYHTPGFSMSLRSIARKPSNLMKAIYNIAVMRHFDTLMRKLKGQAWIDTKNRKAIERTQSIL